MNIFYCSKNGSICSKIEPSFSYDGLYANMTFYATGERFQKGYVTHAAAEIMMRDEGYIILQVEV